MSGLCQVIPKMQPWEPWCPVWTLRPSSPTNLIKGTDNPMGTPCSRTTGHPMTQTLLTRQYQSPEQGQLLQQDPHAVPAVPSRRARPWLLPCLAGPSGCPAAGGTEDGWCQVLRGKGASTRELLQPLSSGSPTCREREMGRHSWSCWPHECKPITLNLGIPPQDLLGTGSHRPFPAAQQSK